MNRSDEPGAAGPKKSAPADPPAQDAARQAPRKPDGQAPTVFRDWAAI